MSSASHGFGLTLAALAAASTAQAQSTERASVGPGWLEANHESDLPAISADGRFVAFESMASNLPGASPAYIFNIYVRDRLTGTTECVSVDSAGIPGDSWSSRAALSADGRFAAFMSEATNLVAGDTNGTWDIFVHDRQSGTTESVSVDSTGVQANSLSWSPSLSADGRFVAFESWASNLVTGDTNGTWDVFVRDRLNGTTERISLGVAGAQGNSPSIGACVSADGRFVRFDSYANNLVAGDTNGTWDVFVRDRLSGTTERVSVDSAGVEGNLPSGAISGGQLSDRSSISPDGRFVVFESEATNLVSGDANGTYDVFVRDRLSGTTQRVSVDSSAVEANDYSLYPSISNDGRFVAFQSMASNLAPGDTNGRSDIFIHDRLSSVTERVSVDSAGVQGNNDSYTPVLANEGRLVCFYGRASNLVPGDTNVAMDVFVRERGGPPPPPAFCFGDGSATTCPCANSGGPGRGCENSASSGGAQLTSAGNAFLSADTFWLRSDGQVPGATSVFLQGSAAVSATSFGDGLRCLGGTLVRLYIRTSPVGGLATAPLASEPSISARSAALGDAISAGSTRYYQTYYRDPVLSFCPSPQGNSWNISSGLAVVWNQ